MTRGEIRKMQALAVVVGLLCLSLYYNTRSISPIPRVAAHAPQAVSTTPPPSIAQRSPDELPSLVMLHEKLPEFSATQRNLFEFGGESFASNDAEDPFLSEDPMASQPGGVPEPEPLPGSDITFIGLYREKGKEAKAEAAISINGRIYVAGEGELVAGRCRVLEIQDNALILSLVPDNAILRYSLGRNNGAPVVLGNARNP